MSPKPVVLNPGVWGEWSTERYGEVTATKVPTPALLDSAYEIHVDGRSVGFVVSRKERGHAVGWDYGTTLSHSQRWVCGMFTRQQAVGALLRETDPKGRKTR